MQRISFLLSTLFLIFCTSFVNLSAQTQNVLQNLYSRDFVSLNGKWNYIIDPLENGYYDYRLQPFKEHGGFFENKTAKANELLEYNFNTAPYMDIPSDWNSKDRMLFMYEGTVWFKRDFKLEKKPETRYMLYFGAVNYDAKVWVNGKKAGDHIGGYTPFNFDVSDLVQPGNNFVVVKVDNKRHRDNVPTVNMDWWNYGGITRDVLLCALPETYIEDYSIQLNKEKEGVISTWVQLNKSLENQSVTIEIPGLKLKQSFTTDASGRAAFDFKAKPELWSPENPKLYDVILSIAGARHTLSLHDKIGFRTIKTDGKKLLLNGKQIFLRGVSIHEEAPFRSGRAWSKEDAETLLGWAKEMGCNYVRLAHYPHNEMMVRTAEKMGLLVWSEIPVYWTISWSNQDTYANAELQLHDMIYRDKNRCAIVIWSIANEPPHSDERDLFLSKLAKYARSQDNTRLISMAMEIKSNESTKTITMEDNMNEYVDIISFNQYMGWYWGGNMYDWTNPQWRIPYNKPVVVSEFGGGCQQGFHGDKTIRFTEENQEALYQCNLEMMEKIDGLSGMSPWILVDFRSPRRQLFGIQDFFNRKGLISDSGNKKKAFFVMQQYYQSKTEEYK
ncbi:MAG: beta-glucuronidase [Dysgonamonadaceae bacterium]|jgi:beta-glucuronidase|nr:beta-glucuronidase [Dysgonamonadaceae bacterium]